MLFYNIKKQNQVDIMILLCWKNFTYVNYCDTHITQDECGLIGRWYEWIGKGKIAMRILSVQIIIPQFYSVCPNNTMWFHIAQVSFPDTYLKSKADRKATNLEPKIFWWHNLACTHFYALFPRPETSLWSQ